MILSLGGKITMKIIKSNDKLAIKNNDDNIYHLFSSIDNETDEVEKTIQYLTNPDISFEQEIDIDESDMNEEEIKHAKNLKKFMDEFLEYKHSKLSEAHKKTT